MDWKQSKAVAVAAVGLIILAVVIVIATRPEKSADEDDNDTTVPVVMLCLACNATAEFTQEEFSSKMSAQTASKCPKCRKGALWMPEKCAKCDAYFVPESQTHPQLFEDIPMPDGSMRPGKSFRDQSCPKCGFKPYQPGSIPAQ